MPINNKNYIKYALPARPVQRAQAVQPIQPVQPVQAVQAVQPVQSFAEQIQKAKQATQKYPKEMETFLANYNDPTELNSYIDALINREAVSKEFGKTWGTVSTASGTVAVLSFIAAAVLGAAAYFTGGATATPALVAAKKGAFALAAAAAVPSIPAAAKVTYDYGIKPIIKGKPKEAGLNMLMNLGETMDYAANPVKGLILEGPKGFVKATGLTSAGRPNYDYDTGSFITDMLLEMVTDPMNLVQFGSSKVINKGISTAAKAQTKQLTDVIVDSANAILKGVENLDVIDDVGRASIQRALQDAVETFGKTLANATVTAKKEVLQETREQLIKAFRENLDQLVYAQLKAAIPNASGHVIDTVLKTAGKDVAWKEMLAKTMPYIEQYIKFDDLTSNVILGLSSLVKSTDTLDKFARDAALFTSGYGGALKLVLNKRNPLIKYLVHSRNKRIKAVGEKLQLFDSRIGGLKSLAKYEEGKALVKNANTFFEKHFSALGYSFKDEDDLWYTIITRQLERDQHLIRKAIQDHPGKYIEQAAALDALFQELYGHDFKTYIAYLKQIDGTESGLYKNFSEYAETQYNALTKQSTMQSLTQSVKTGAKLYATETISDLAAEQVKVIQKLTNLKDVKNIDDAVEALYSLQVNSYAVNAALINDPEIYNLFVALLDTNGLGAFLDKIIADPEGILRELNETIYTTASAIEANLNALDLPEAFKKDLLTLLKSDKFKKADTATRKKLLEDYVTTQKNIKFNIATQPLTEAELTKKLEEIDKQLADYDAAVAKENSLHISEGAQSYTNTLQDKVYKHYYALREKLNLQQQQLSQAQRAKQITYDFTTHAQLRNTLPYHEAKFKSVRKSLNIQTVEDENSLANYIQLEQNFNSTQREYIALEQRIKRMPNTDALSDEREELFNDLRGLKKKLATLEQQRTQFKKQFNGASAATASLYFENKQAYEQAAKTLAIYDYLSTKQHTTLDDVIKTIEDEIEETEKHIKQTQTWLNNKVVITHGESPKSTVPAVQDNYYRRTLIKERERLEQIKADYTNYKQRAETYNTFVTYASKLSPDIPNVNALEYADAAKQLKLAAINFINMRELYDGIAKAVFPKIDGVADDAFKRYIIDQIFGFTEDATTLLYGFESNTLPNLIARLEYFLSDSKHQFKFTAEQLPIIQDQITNIFKAYLQAQQHAGIETVNASIAQAFTDTLEKFQQTFSQAYPKEFAEVTDALFRIRTSLAAVKNLNTEYMQQVLLGTKSIFSALSARQLSDYGLALRLIAETKNLDLFDLTTNDTLEVKRLAQDIGKKINQTKEACLQYAATFTDADKKHIQALYKEVTDYIIKAAKFASANLKTKTYALLKPTDDYLEQFAQLTELYVFFQNTPASKQMWQVFVEKLKIPVEEQNILRLIHNPKALFSTEFSWDAMAQSAYYAERDIHEAVLNVIGYYDNVTLAAKKGIQTFEDAIALLSTNKLDQPKVLQMQRYIKPLKRVTEHMDYIRVKYDNLKITLPLERDLRTFLSKNKDKLARYFKLPKDTHEQILDELQDYWDGKLKDTIVQEPAYLKNVPGHEYKDTFTPFWERVKSVNEDIRQAVAAYNRNIKTTAYDAFMEARMVFNKNVYHARIQREQLNNLRLTEEYNPDIWDTEAKRNPFLDLRNAWLKDRGYKRFDINELQAREGYHKFDIFELEQFAKDNGYKYTPIAEREYYDAGYEDFTQDNIKKRYPEFKRWTDKSVKKEWKDFLKKRIQADLGDFRKALLESTDLEVLQQRYHYLTKEQLSELLKEKTQKDVLPLIQEIMACDYARTLLQKTELTPTEFTFLKDLQEIIGETTLTRETLSKQIDAYWDDIEKQIGEITAEAKRELIKPYLDMTYFDYHMQDGSYENFLRIRAQAYEDFNIKLNKDNEAILKKYREYINTKNKKAVQKVLKDFNTRNEKVIKAYKYWLNTEYNQAVYEKYIKDLTDHNAPIIRRFKEEVLTSEAAQKYPQEIKEYGSKPERRLEKQGFIEPKEALDKLADLEFEQSIDPKFSSKANSIYSDIYTKYITEINRHNELAYETYQRNLKNVLPMPEYVTPWDAIREQQRFNKIVQKATDTHSVGIMYDVLSLSPEEFIKQLAHSHRYAMFFENDIANDKALKSLFIRLRNALDKDVVTYHYDSEKQIHYFVLNKKQKVNYDGRKVLLNGELIKREYKPRAYTAFKELDDFIQADEAHSTVDMLNRLEQDMFELTGSTFGYSQGLPMSVDVQKKIYEQLPDEVKALLDETELFDPKNYDAFCFNESVFGSAKNKAKLGIYSNNMLITAQNTITHAMQYAKAKSEYINTAFDSLLNISSENSVFKNFTDEDLLEALQSNSEYKLTMLVYSKKHGLKVKEIIPLSVADIQFARAQGATILPTQVYKDMYKSINLRLGSTGFAKIWNRLIYVYKFGYLLRPGAWIRNYIDTNLKTNLEIGTGAKDYRRTARNILRELEEINDYVMKRSPDGTLKRELIQEYFRTRNKPNSKLTIELYYDIVGTYKPQGLLGNIMSDALEDGTDLWSTFTHYSGKIIDVFNKTEEVNRLAFLLAELDKGTSKTKMTSALARLSKVHFDYSFKSGPEQLLEMIFPFSTFTLRNLSYWTEALEKHPWLMRNYVHFMKPHWDFKDYTPEQLAANYQVQNQILNGQLKLGEFNDKVLLFKLNPSINDALQMFSDPINNIYEKFAAPIKAPIKLFTDEYYDPLSILPVVGPLIQSGKQMLSKGTPLPSIITTMDKPRTRSSGNVNFRNKNLANVNSYRDKQYRRPTYTKNVVYDSYALKGTRNYRTRFYPIIDIAQSIKARYSVNVANQIKKQVETDVYKGIMYSIRLDTNRFRS